MQFEVELCFALGRISGVKVKMGQKMEQGQEKTDLSGPEFKTLKAKGERQKLLTKKSEYESIQYEKKNGKRNESVGGKRFWRRSQ